MESFLYDLNAKIIAALLFLVIVMGVEIGYRLGLRKHRMLIEPTKSQINAIQASMLALLALVIGFTFSLSLQRFDDRAFAVVDEANAIGTTYLRTLLLPDLVREDAQRLTREYIDFRLAASLVPLNENETRSEVIAKSTSKLGELWNLTAKEARKDGGPVTSGLFITSLNETIDSFGSRDAIVKRHVPELVLILLFATFILTAGIIGFASGAADHRPSIAVYVLVLLIVLLVYLIIDLDRPRRGLIKVPQDSIQSTHEWIHMHESRLASH